MSKSDTIDAMTAGYWLDELVAIKIFGMKKAGRGDQMWVYPDGKYDRLHEYSTDIVPAREVLRELERQGWKWSIRYGDKLYRVAIMKLEWATDSPFMTKAISSATAETIPLAICKAAIKLSHHEEYEEVKNE